MRKELKPIAISMLLSLCTILGSIYYTNTALAQQSIQSTGKVIYQNPETGEKVVIDTADVTVLQSEIDNISDEVDTIKSGLYGLETQYGNVSFKDTPNSNSTIYVKFDKPFETVPYVIVTYNSAHFGNVGWSGVSGVTKEGFKIVHNSTWGEPLDRVYTYLAFTENN